MILCGQTLRGLSCLRLAWKFFLWMLLCVQSTLLCVQAVEIADIVLATRTSHLDIRGTAGGRWHTFDCRRYAMLIVGQPVSWIAWCSVRTNNRLDLLLFYVARWLCHRAALLAFVRSDLSEAWRLVSLVWARTVLHFLQFACQCLWSGTGPSQGIISQSSVLAFLRKRSFCTLSARTINNGRGGNHTATRNCLLLTRLPDLLRVVQALVLRVDRGS